MIGEVSGFGSVEGSDCLAEMIGPVGGGADCLDVSE